MSQMDHLSEDTSAPLFDATREVLAKRLRRKRKMIDNAMSSMAPDNEEDDS